MKGTGLKQGTRVAAYETARSSKVMKLAYSLIMKLVEVYLGVRIDNLAKKKKKIPPHRQFCVTNQEILYTTR